MKHIFMILFICIGLFASANAQKTKVSPAAEKSFMQKFPNAKEVTWEKEGKNEYEASFMMDGKKGSANFSSAGEWMETEMAIPQANAPKAVMEAFNKAFAGASIKEIYKIESKDGKNYFEIEYSVKGKVKEAKIDAAGKMM